MEFRSVKLHKAFEDELLFLIRDILHRRGYQFVLKDQLKHIHTSQAQPVGYLHLMMMSTAVYLYVRSVDRTQFFCSDFNIFLPRPITVDLALCLQLDTQIQFKPNIISSSCSHWILVDAGLQISPKINAKHVEPAVAEDLAVVQHYFLHGAKLTSSFAFRCRLVHLQHVCSVNITVSWTINSK